MSFESCLLTYKYRFMEIVMKKIHLLIVITLFFFVSPIFAGEADVLDVQVRNTGERVYKFDVTVLHKDTGWEHYANKWDVIDEKGEILGTRILHHPHVDEQPFTRSLSGVNIPKNIKKVVIRAHDSVHKYGGEVVSVQLP